MLLLLLGVLVALTNAADPSVALEALLAKYVDTFNSMDEELYVNDVPNSGALAFLRDGIPLFECPDADIERTYYFRWWTWRKHVRTVPVPLQWKSSRNTVVLSEFMPAVSWAGPGNTICAAAGHHFMEGRWFRGNDSILDGYAHFWLRDGGNPRRYSFWVAHSLWSRFLVTGRFALLRELLPMLLQNYKFWDKMRLDSNGLYWQKDDLDGMEMSIGGETSLNGYRATINSYMYGDARAIARIAKLSGDNTTAAAYEGKAREVKRLVEEKLWDNAAGFFKVLPRVNGSSLVDVRELHGYTPWYFGLPSADKSGAWSQLIDSMGFNAEYGLTTAEQRHPRFRVSYDEHECQWNGPSWPYATSVTLTALANLFASYRRTVIRKKHYYELLATYARSHQRRTDSGAIVPWIDENLNPFTGDWISRTRLSRWRNGTWAEGKGGRERGKDYNHSTFCDLVISGLVGVRPRAGDVVEVRPLLPRGRWPYFILDRVPYHGRLLRVVWDRSGLRYGLGAGFSVFVDGELRANNRRLANIKFTLLPPSAK